MSDAPWSGRRLHFIGIGGAGMSGLAIVALGLGAQVSGSDRAETAYTERLRELGLAPAIGHDPGNLPDGAEVVVSTAISEGNVELAAAREAGARILHRGELLGAVSRLQRCLAGPAPTLIVPAGLELHGVPPSLTFGIESGTLAARELDLLPLGSRFTVDGVGVELRVPGRHNVLNALAALAACREAGVPPQEAAPALGSFTGAARRFEPHGRGPNGALVFDDYAHHPTEVRATLEAARTLEPERLVAVFQPHLYSRTHHLAREFGRALALADLVVALDIYPAREKAEDYPGVSGWLVATATADASGGRPVYWLPRLDQAEGFLRGELRDGDLLLPLGVGEGLATLERDGNRVICGGGARLPQASARAARWGLTGLECGVNIPGTVGGAVKMNANAYGGELGKVLEWVDIATPGGAECRTP